MRTLSASFSIGIALAVLSLFLPVKISTAIWVLSAMAIFYPMGGMRLVLVYAVVFILAGSDMTFRGSVVKHFTPDLFEPFDGWNMRELRGDTLYRGVEELSVNGKGIKVVMEEDFGGVLVFRGMKVDSRGKLLIVRSDLGGKVIVRSMKKIEINGLNIEFEGKGSLDGLEVNGVSNRVSIVLSSTPRIVVNGVGNSLEIRITEVKSGNVRVYVSGTGNDVTVFLPFDSSIHVTTSENPPFLNEVKIVRGNEL